MENNVSWIKSLFDSLGLGDNANESRWIEYSLKRLVLGLVIFSIGATLFYFELYWLISSMDDVLD